MLRGDHRWHRSIVTHGNGNTVWCRNWLFFRGNGSLRICCSVLRGRNSAGRGHVCRAVHSFFPQDSGFQNVAVEHAQEREDVWVSLFQKCCFPFPVEVKGCGECRGEPKDNSACMYICWNVLLVFVVLIYPITTVSMLVFWLKIWRSFLLCSPFPGEVKELTGSSGNCFILMWSYSALWLSCLAWWCAATALF